MRLIFSAFALLTLLGCSQSSPAMFHSRNLDGNVEFLRTQPNQTICAKIEKGQKLSIKHRDSVFDFQDAYEKLREAATIVFRERGYDPNYCNDTEKYEYIAARNFYDYFIDRLRIKVEQMKEDNCSTGGIYKIFLEGEIGPDSSFAIGEILKKTPHCQDSKENIISATTVALSSGGGYLEDGYTLGRMLQKAGVNTIIESGNICASSCAVAFLGGEKRLVEPNAAIMFHAPYQLMQDKLGITKSKADCNVGEEQLQALKSYYLEMTNPEEADRLFERTMWYCSTSEGWVVVGNDAATLYGIATDD